MTRLDVARRPTGVAAAPGPEAPAPAEEPMAVVPRHVAIIMDGNRRWARLRNVPEAEGHAAGVEAIRPVMQHAVRRGIEVLSLYAFSRENWSRSSSEALSPSSRQRRTASTISERPE